MPNGISDRGVMFLHHLQVLSPGFLNVGLDDTIGNEVILHLTIRPGGVDVILRVVQSFPGGVGTRRNPTGNGVGDSGGERIAGILVRVVVVFREEDQLLLRTFRLHNTLFEKELAETRFIPGLKGGVLEVLEGLLSVAVLVV